MLGESSLFRMCGISLNVSRKLAAAAPRHPFSLDLEAKSSLFDEAAGKFEIVA